MRSSNFSLGAAFLIGALSFANPGDAGPQAAPPVANAELLDADTLGEIKRLYRVLIDAENRLFKQGAFSSAQKCRLLADGVEKGLVIFWRTVIPSC
jgi:hypothetical protein